MSESQEKPHRTGAFWLDLVLAISAVAISCISLWVASRADRTQERLLAAGVWPYVEFSTSNFENDVNAIQLSLRNAGVGPARIRWMTLDYHGRPMRDPDGLLAACCESRDGVSLTKTLVTSTVTHTVLVPHESVSFVVVTPKGVDQAAYRALNNQRMHLHVRVCYCSVLDQCWLLDNHSEEDPQPVGNCSPLPANAFEG